MQYEYILKHGDTDVCSIVFNNDFYIERTDQVINDEHLPPYILQSSKQTIFTFNEWYSSRAISNNRDGIQDILKRYNSKNTRELLTKNYGLSLYDHYWVCPSDKNLKWNEVNFFDNKFKEDAGNILVGDFSANVINGITPESSSGGMLPKKWSWRGGKTYLIKRGSGYYKQEPFNEVIASTIMKKMGINCVEYTLEWKGNEPQSCCKNMLDGKNELIHAWDIVHEMDEKFDKYSRFFEMTKNVGISDIKLEINKMLVADYIIANTDRHFNNIGFLRNAKTLKYSGIAPIYDSGTSLWHDKDIDEINGEKGCKSKPFKGQHREQIKKVADLSWLDTQSLKNIDEIVIDILKNSKKIKQDRIYAIAEKVHNRTKKIKQIKLERTQEQDYDGYGL